MILNIKNMVCNRCITAVCKILDSINCTIIKISLGEVKIKEQLTQDELQILSEKLKDEGFELLLDKNDKIIEKIKNLIVDLVHYTSQPLNIKLSVFLADKMNKDYKYLSSLFSQNQNKTIERFFIEQKIERIKELLQNNKLNLSEIAYKMGYSSSAYLSNQFKKITGVSPSQYKKENINDRKPLDMV